MKANKIFLALSLICVLGLSSCRDEFAELNQNPTAVSTPEPAYMLTQCILNFDVSGYTYWFYNQPAFTKWTQMGATGTFSEASYSHGATDGQSTYLEMLKYRNDIDNYIETFGKPELKAYSAICGVLAVYGAIFSSDINGDIQYTEACLYRYGGSLTPAYDRVENLYGTLLAELDGYINTFQDGNQVFVPKQDLIYNGDMKKWCKLANTLKIKIAARLYNNDPAKAKEIVQNVASSDIGYIDSIDDSFLFHKADASSGGDEAYQTGNSYVGWMSRGSENVIEYMKACRDPRVRFVYAKNDFNSKIVQGFIDRGRYDDLPGYVRESIVLDGDGNFQEWAGLGEPWVRYHGIPIVKLDSPEHNALKGEFFETGVRYNLQKEDGTGTKGYGLTSDFNEEMIRGRVDFTLPTLPGDAVIQDNDDVAWWGMYLGAGETNLYLAEFSLLGASLPKTAEEYYKRGVELSVKEYDKLAANNRIPYYGVDYKYDPNEVSIELKDGEIEAMLATDFMKFEGSTEEKLEKVYLQQLMNFSLQPDDQFVTARRSGYPKVGSKLLPFVKFDGIALEAIPRRFEVTEPAPTSIMYDIRMQNLRDQGFTPGTAQSGIGYSTGTVLNTERLWQDKNAPQWGTPRN